MRKVELRMNEQEKYEVIKELVDHNGNKNRASKKLGISRRQIDRLIIKAFNGDLLVTIDEQILELKELSRNQRFSKEFDEVIEVKEKKKYISPMTHPWKLSSFLKQIEKSHNQHQYA